MLLHEYIYQHLTIDFLDSQMELYFHLKKLDLFI